MSDWQDATTIVILIAVAGYVAWCVVHWFQRNGAPDCRCCLTCPAKPGQKTVVTLDKPPKA